MGKGYRKMIRRAKKVIGKPHRGPCFKKGCQLNGLEPGQALSYLIAVQLKKLSDRQLAAGGLAGLGATMAAAMLGKAEKKP